MSDTFKGIITADGKKRQLPYGSILDKPVSDETLSIQGGFADAKVVGNKFKEVKTETNSLKEDLDYTNELLSIQHLEFTADSTGNYYKEYLINNGDTYIFTVDSIYNCSIATCLNDKTVVENVGNVMNGNSIVFKATKNAEMVLFYFRANGTAKINKKNFIQKTDEKISQLSENENKFITKQWRNKLWSSYGDSISWLYGWQTIVNNILGFSDYVRNGKPGSTIAWSSNTFHINEQGIYDESCNGDTVHDGFCSYDRISKCIDNTLPLIFVMGGTNDYLSSVPIGNTSFNTNNDTDSNWNAINPVGDYDIETLKGAMASMFMKLQYHAPNALIVFGTLLNGIGNESGVNQYSETINSIGLTPSDYARAQIEVCREFGIPCIDVFGNCGINATNRATYISDTVHPNAEGMKLLARCVASGLSIELNRI